MPSHDSNSDSDSGSEVDSLSTGDIKLVKNFLQTFEFIAARASTRPDEGSTKGQSNTPAIGMNRNDPTPTQANPLANRFAVYEDYRRKSDDLKREISELLRQMKRVGAHETASIHWYLIDTNEFISRLDDALYDALYDASLQDGSMDNIMSCLRDLQVKCSDILRSLYRQNHAFRFLQRLVGDLIMAQDRIVLLQPDMKAKLSIVFSEVVPQLKQSFSFVKKDFRSFSNKTLPEFVNEEEERATTRYLTLTTIATFFSSITATTLQFSFEGETNTLSGIVNLFWYLSLVFSVSSGINSLLSMLWRKSAVYSEERRPPICIKLWLTDAPIYFLAISAFAFIIGLSLFVYSSNQPSYVASTTIGFAALHVLCLLVVMIWFIVRRKWTTISVQFLRRYLLWILLFENETFDANRFFGAKRNWPKSVSPPSTLAKLLRLFVTLLRASFRILKRYILFPFLKIPLMLAFLQDVIKRMKGSKATQIISTPSASGDVESREHRANEPKETPPTNVESAIMDFTAALRDTFASTGVTDSKAVADFRQLVRDWASGSYPVDTFDITLRNLLWGYPDLLKQFRQKVLPALEAEDSARINPMGISPEPQVSNTVGNQSSMDLSLSGPTTINSGGPGGNKETTGPSDAGSSVQILNEGRDTGYRQDKAAKVPSSPSGAVGEKGSDHERRKFLYEGKSP